MFSYLNGGLAADYLAGNDALGAVRDKKAYDVTTVTLDVDGTQGWTSIEEVHSDLGDLLSKTVEMDNGATFHETYTGGVLTLQSVTDTAANDRDWQIRTVEWNSAGVKTQRTTVDDDGVSTVEIYDLVTGNRTERTETDDGDAYSWATRTQFWDDSGTVKIGAQHVHDGGRIVDTVKDPGTGIMTSRLTTDGGDKRNWDTRLETFDAATGARDSRLITYDNGDTLAIDFVNGKRATAVQTDVNDDRSWTTRTETYGDGEVTSRGFVYDDNSGLSHTFSGGQRTSTTRVDGNADTFEWQFRTREFDADGATTKITDFMDDGDLIETVFDPAGHISDVTTTDLSGDETWHVERVFYDATGSVTGTDYFDALGNPLIV
ncbi:MAG: hypothetical protein AAFP16_15915 [Pseudomonadota bacterium]